MGLGRFRAGLGALALLALPACDVLPPIFVTPEPPAPEAPPPPSPAPVTSPKPSARSEALAASYRRLQERLLAQNLLRGDGGGADTPFTSDQLARDFIRIALFDEYSDDGDFSRPQARETQLRRWTRPIRMRVVHDPLTPTAEQQRDFTSVSTYAARLSRLTGVPITMVAEAAPANYHVLFLGEDTRKTYGDELRRLIPNIPDSTVRAFENLPQEQLCLVIGTFQPGSSRYQTAVALIRAEHPTLMRIACIHEELAQGMGLANDSPAARPSIFNDDEEFARLTRHDEFLLQMLYDPRLRPGMTAIEAAPIARTIALELTGDGSS